MLMVLRSYNFEPSSVRLTVDVGVFEEILR
jgi:hypothetical protein